MSNMVVQTNVLALNSHRNMKGIGTQQSKASQRLSSGFKINSAADDAAGLAISEKMRAQIRGLDMASKNAQDGISMIQTAEGGLTEVDNMIQRIRELVVQGSNDTNTSEDRAKLDKEVNALTAEITEMGGRVEFNTQKLLNKSVSSASFQIGANSDQQIDALAVIEAADVVTGADVTAITDADALKMEGKTSADITAYLDTIDTALTAVTDARAGLGAVQNRLEYTIKSLDVSSENLSAAESRIRDTDMAKEMMSLTKSNVLQQASISMLSQANQAPQSILKLLQ